MLRGAGQPAMTEKRPPLFPRRLEQIVRKSFVSLMAVVSICLCSAVISVINRLLLLSVLSFVVISVISVGLNAVAVIALFLNAVVLIGLVFNAVD